MKALVYKSTGSWYVVKVSDTAKVSDTYYARMKGVFKIDGITSTNPVAVGDEVELEMENEIESTATIIKIYDRRNHINRQSPRAKYQQHIIAANVDQSLLMATLKEPKTSQGFIDRFLVASEMYHVPSIIVFNKADLYGKKEMQKFERGKEMYEAIGYRIILMSVHENKGIDKVKGFLKGKITLISGHSGVGKSSFLNALIPDLQLKTQDVSGWSGKGLHTTSFVEMFDLPTDSNRDGGKIIDTPGMREFGLIDITKQELSHYFPEMRERLNGCQFNNCLHINEPGCMIKQAVQDNVVHEDRYVSYVNILDSIQETRY